MKTAQAPAFPYWSLSKNPQDLWMKNRPSLLETGCHFTARKRVLLTCLSEGPIAFCMVTAGGWGFAKDISKFFFNDAGFEWALIPTDPKCQHFLPRVRWSNEVFTYNSSPRWIFLCWIYPMVACPVLGCHNLDPYIGSNDHNFYLFYTSIIKEESEMAPKLL